MITFTHTDKMYWKKDRITKQHLLDYYAKIAPYILRYLKNRPVVLHRFPNGIQGEHFYQKESGLHIPTFMKTVTIEHTEKNIAYFVIQNINSLLYIANLGSIELHIFNARIQHLEQPDYFIFDLDPFGISFKAVVDTALALHEFFEENNIPNFCKTTGGTGLHVCIPLKAKYGYDILKKFGALIARLIHDKLSSITSLERSPQKRRKKVYIDIMQNQKMQTHVCPYSLRGFPHAPVATPLLWHEVSYDLDPLDFNIHTVPQRLKAKGDLLAPLLKKSIPLTQVVNSLQNLQE